MKKMNRIFQRDDPSGVLKDTCYTDTPRTTISIREEPCDSMQLDEGDGPKSGVSSGLSTLSQDTDTRNLVDKNASELSEAKKAQAV